MASYIYNATNRKQTVKALGNWFELKPKQIKRFNENIADFLSKDRKEYGLVALSDNFDDPEYKTTDEGKAELAKAEEEGIAAYLDFHRSVVYNNQVSLRQNLEGKNMKVDPAVLASPGELESMRILAEYKQQQEDLAEARIKEVKDLMKKVGPVSK